MALGDHRLADDAGGGLAIRALRQKITPEIADVVEIEAGTPDLLDRLLKLWNGRTHVVVIASCVTGKAPGTIAHWNASAGALGIELGPPHATQYPGPASAIETARTLGRLPQRLEVYGIESAYFAAGAPPDPRVRAAAQQLATDLALSLTGHPRLA